MGKRIKKADFNPLVSIIIPVYNGANYVREAIDSALAQTYKNIEIIVVNDGSQDNTEEIVKSYGNKLRYFKKENGGVSTALNLGIKKMRGEYFSWLSHDDLYYPDKIEKQIIKLFEINLKDRNKTILMSNYALINEKSEITYESNFEKNHLISKLEHPLYGLFNGLINGLTLLIPRNCFERVGYFDEKLRATQDYDLWFRMFPKYKLVFMKDLLAKTRIHSGQVTNKPSTLLENDKLWIKMIKGINDIQKIEIGGTLLFFYKKTYEVVKNARFKGVERYLWNILKNIKSKNISKIKISVIIPFFNRIAWTIEAVKSVINQSHKNFEIILINDFSTNSIRSLEKFIEGDNRIILIKNKRKKGVSGARNTGIDVATGQYISFLDSDDLFLPNKLRDQLKFMVKKNLVFTHTSYEYFSGKRNMINISNFSCMDIVYPDIISDCPIATSTVMLYADLFKNISNRFIENYIVGEDTCLWIKISEIFPCIGFKPILSRIRIHGDNAVYDIRKVVKGVDNILTYVMKNHFDLNISSFLFSLNDFLINSGMKGGNKEFRKYFRFSNLQISDNDLIGNKFNGHDLHNYLNENGVASRQLVWNKESNDLNTFMISADKEDRLDIQKNILEMQKRYYLNSIINPIAYDIIYNKFFLESDIIHFHLIHNNIFDIQLLPIISKLKPIVWTLHDPWSLGGHCIHHFDCNKWKKQCGDCPYISEDFRLEKDNSTFNFEIKKTAIQNSNFDVIVASKWMEKKVKQSPIFKSKKIHLIPFGVNQNIFKPMDKNMVRKELNIPIDAIVLTFRCTYSGFKGMDYIEYVLRKIKTKKKIFVITLQGNYKNKKNSLIYKEYGWIKDDNFLAKIYNATDLFLAPSKADSFGMMAVEAMCCGILPIVLEGTALPEIVNYPDCGVSVKRDKQKYLDKVQYYIDHKDKREKQALKCLIYARKKYNKENYVKKIIEVYDQVIKRHIINVNDNYLLCQLKKYVAIELSSKPISYKKRLSKIVESIMIKSIMIKSIIKKYILICFYKIDKIFPKKIRRIAKQKLVKYSFVKKYLIK
jgi:glycosyltransferase involved in cell wall biosynthesis